MTSRFPPFALVELVSRVAFVGYNKSMASRFASISGDEEVKEFKKKLENDNTKKKTLYDIKVFKEYPAVFVKLDYFETQ